MFKAVLSAVVLMAGVSSVGFAADKQDNFTKLLQSSPMGKKAISELSSATEIKNASITSYNCFILVVEQLKGKCAMVIEVNGKSSKVVASPEVAAPYSNDSTASESRPHDGLTLKISKSGEILDILKDGRRISNKIDFSR